MSNMEKKETCMGETLKMLLSSLTVKIINR